MRPGILIIVILLLGGLGLVTAKESICPAFAEFALERTNQVCDITGRNQACYGHMRLEAEPRAEVTDFHFNQIGDIAPVNAIHSLRLSAFDPNNSLWGIALMRLQANVPDTIPGQNVTFLMFGDVAVTSAVSTNPVLKDISSTADIPVFSYPVPSAPALGMLQRETVVVADGRLADSSWLRIEMPLGVQSVGWIPNSRLNLHGSMDELEVIDPADARPRYRPMQAFYLTTGHGTPICNEIPTAGVVIQSPKTAGKINLLVNDVEVRIGSTVMFQAQADGDMTITTLEGSALVKVGRAPIQEVVAGMRVHIPLDHNLRPIGPPSRPERYDDPNGRRMPIANLNVPPETNLKPTEEPQRQAISAPVKPPPEIKADPPPVPTAVPTQGPFEIPTELPTETPTAVITETSTLTPTLAYTETPTNSPTQVPSIVPTTVPTRTPTWHPTKIPTSTGIPTAAPTLVPTNTPDPLPSPLPTDVPTLAPTQPPTDVPTQLPTDDATVPATAEPTEPSSPTDVPPAPTHTPEDVPDQPTPTPTRHYRHPRGGAPGG